jgi:hypothetical protein
VRTVGKSPCRLWKSHISILQRVAKHTLRSAPTWVRMLPCNGMKCGQLANWEKTP